MRLLLASVVVCMLTARGYTCPEVDETFVQGSGVQMGRGESKIATVPPRPSFFVHIGRDSGPEMPVFTRLDGTVIPYARSVTLNARWDLRRIDLETEAGVILVRSADESSPKTYVVDPDFKPATRSTEVRGAYNTLVIDSDAVVLRLDYPNGRSETFLNWGGFDLDPHEAFRVVAIYGDRTEEEIFDHRPPRTEPEPTTSSDRQSLGGDQGECPELPIMLALLSGLLLVVRRNASMYFPSDTI